MATEPVAQSVDVFRQTIVALVRRDGPDLTARQLGVFLTCYLENEAQTVRGLAVKLDVAKASNLSCARSSLRVRSGASEDRPSGPAQHLSPADDFGVGVPPRTQEDTHRRRERDQ